MTKFLANENIPRPSIDILRNFGLDILSIAEKHSGISDDEVIELSIKTNRTIITLDSDYGELIFKSDLRPPAGVIYFRIIQQNPQILAHLFIEYLGRDIDYRNKLTVIRKDNLRQRLYQSLE